jgi:hypothetical protein
LEIALQQSARYRAQFERAKFFLQRFRLSRGLRVRVGGSACLKPMLKSGGAAA